jgi:hypothetical protein
LNINILNTFNQHYVPKIEQLSYMKPAAPLSSSLTSFVSSIKISTSSTMLVEALSDMNFCPRFPIKKTKRSLRVF